MTVRELIAALAQFDPELPVLVDGHEFGLDNAQSPRVVTVKTYTIKHSYHGEFEEIGGNFADVEGEPIQAVVIERPV